MYYAILLSMMKTRDRSNEMNVYISKQHHLMLKKIAQKEGRSMRVVLERMIAFHGYDPLDQ